MHKSISVQLKKSRQSNKEINKSKDWKTNMQVINISN